ncbi:DUF5690 family protein [Luteolibacter marinus]|uniref:DUF5690 family protein n=1 Tax=Luteolibacter marinus TaxID=2776705 RepID=UPI0018682A8D|nr:DUF5690 family protein [Luteolibacter marinus]
MNPPPSRSPLSRALGRPGFLAGWCVVAAFGTYACMYGFRKPFTAASFGGTTWGESLKVWYVTAQVLGYMVSKFIGIKVVSEITAGRRARLLLGLIAVAQLALVAFALTPAPWSAGWLFCNGLPLGMVFGLVLGFLEGRRMTEFFVAGLCASFILADGVTKSVGAALLKSGVSEPWMPAAAGAIFLLPLIGFVLMLARIPAAEPADVLARSERTPMNGAERLAMVRRHGVGLVGIVVVYLLITILRSVRADFAPEIWSHLGLGEQPGVFTRSEFWVGLAVTAVNGLVFLIRDNRRGFFCGLWISAGGLMLALASVAGWRSGLLPPFAFMVLIGVGMYLPYVAVHTTLFERLIALTREKGNMTFLMYVADATGYLGYCGVMLARSLFHPEDGFLAFFVTLSTAILAVALGLLVLAILLYRHRFPRGAAAVSSATVS